VLKACCITFLEVFLRVHLENRQIFARQWLSTPTWSGSSRDDAGLLSLKFPAGALLHAVFFFPSVTSMPAWVFPHNHRTDGSLTSFNGRAERPDRGYAGELAVPLLTFFVVGGLRI